MNYSTHFLGLLAALLTTGCVTTGGKSLGETISKLNPLETSIEQRWLDSVKQPYVPGSMAINTKLDLDQRRGVSFGLIDSRELSTYLNGIRQRLLSNSGFTDVPGDVFVEANQEINANTTAGGNIYLYMGLISKLESEDEVAAVIAHELGHVLLKHYESGVFMTLQRQLQFGQEKTFWLRQAMRNIETNSKSGLSSSDQKRIKNAELIARLTKSVINPSWQRGQEEQADLLGIDLMAKGGYNPDGMLKIHELLGNKPQQSPEEKRKQAQQTIQLIAELASEKDTQTKFAAGTELLTMFMGHDHPEPTKRKALASAYLNKHYEDVGGPYQKSAWIKLLKAKPVSDIFRTLDQSFAAQNAFDSGDYKKAFALSSAATAPETRQSYPNFVHALVLENMGRGKEAETFYGRALKAPEPAGQAYTQYASYKARQNNYAEALRITQLGFTRFGKPPGLVPNLVRYARHAGNSQAANDYVEDCKLSYSDMRDECLLELTN